MSYIGTQPVPQSLESRQEFTATASQKTTFATNGYTVGYVDVYLNGVKLSTSDFTATNGSDIVLNSDATAGDVLAVVMKNDHSDLVALPITDSQGNNVLSESGGTVTLTADSVNIDGGTVDGVTIGGTTPAAGYFTTLNTSNAVVFNDAGADVDFRVEGDTDSNLLFVNAGLDRVGIGTSSPVAKLDVNGSYQGAGNIITSSGFIRSPDGSAATPSIQPGVDADTGFYRPATNTIGFATAGTERMSINQAGTVTVIGSLSKGSGSFKIKHPLDSKSESHYLVHSFIEGPQADLIYRGKVQLVNGFATVNIDSVSGMTEGTFVLLNREVQCFTSNESGWTNVRGSVSGNILTIEAEDNNSSDTISWLVIGERQDQHMYDTEWTDENGKVIVEPLKEIDALETPAE